MSRVVVALEEGRNVVEHGAVKPQYNWTEWPKGDKQGYAGRSQDDYGAHSSRGTERKGKCNHRGHSGRDIRMGSRALVAAWVVMDRVGDQVVRHGRVSDKQGSRLGGGWTSVGDNMEMSRAGGRGILHNLRGDW